MFNFRLGLKKRARVGVEWELPGIIARLDRLETAPPPSLTPQQIEATLSAIREGLSSTFEAADARFDGLESAVEEVTVRLKATNFAVSEGIERTDRAERRIHATIKRARKEFKARGYEDPGLEEEAYQLRLVDGDRGADGELPTVPESVGEGAEVPSSIKGVPAETLRRVRGY